MKMSLTENIPYNTETCTSYTLIFGATNDYGQSTLTASITTKVGDFKKQAQTITNIPVSTFTMT